MRAFSSAGLARHTRPVCVHGRCSAQAHAGGPETEDLVRLGGSELKVSTVGLGTIAWGDPGQGWGQRFVEADVSAMCSAAVVNGINFLDTAEVYGYQNASSDNSSECLIRRCALTQPTTENGLVVGSKYFTIPWTNFLLGGGFRFGQQSLSDALDATLARLGVETVDLYQIHFPFPSYSQQVLTDALRDAVESGRARAVAVCNYNAQQLEEAAELLGKHGIPLASNQFEYNLVKRSCETNGLLEACKRCNVTPIAHSPLRQGLLTEFALERSDAEASKVKPLLKLMQFLGALSGGKSIEQVALNYLMCKGAVVIPGAKSVGQVERNAGAMGWRLEENEVEVLNERLQALKL